VKIENRSLNRSIWPLHPRRFSLRPLQSPKPILPSVLYTSDTISLRCFSAKAAPFFKLSLSIFLFLKYGRKSKKVQEGWLLSCGGYRVM